MKFFRSLFVFCLLLTASVVGPGGLAAQTLSKSARAMREATMATYNKLLAEDPDDYETLYSRASAYYRDSDYASALADINRALKVAPKSDTSTLFDLYSLRAGIYSQLGKNASAVSDYKRATELHPDDYNARYQLANAEFLTGDYAAAKSDYLQLRRMNSRSQEAYFGLARVAAKEGNTYEAGKLLDQAVEINPSAALTYIRLGNVLRMTGKNVDAVDNYLKALSIDEKVLSSALYELTELAKIDYPAVIEGLGKAIATDPRNGRLRYIRGMIAKSHYHYLPALADFNEIVDKNLLWLPSIYTDIAECYFALGDYEAALTKADYAIGATSQSPAARLVKAKIKLAEGNYKDAGVLALKAMEGDKSLVEARLVKALADEAAGDYASASEELAGVIADDSKAPANYFYRAYLLSKQLEEEDAAAELYNEVLNLDFDERQAASLKGFAFLFLGDTQAGDAWINTVVADSPDSDGEVSYYAACYWAQRGDIPQALKSLEKALKAGYANYTNLTNSNFHHGGINVEPLRSRPEFKALLKRYGSLFDNGK